MSIFIVSIVDFKQVSVCWGCTHLGKWLFKTSNQDMSVTSLDVIVLFLLLLLLLLILNMYLVTKLFATIEPHLGLLENIVGMEWELLWIIISNNSLHGTLIRNNPSVDRNVTI